MNRMHWMQRPLFIALCLGLLLPLTAQSQTVEPHYYVKKDTWHETMLASRARYLEWYDWLPVRQSPLYMSNLTNRVVTDADYLHYPADVSAVDAKGTPLWEQVPRSKDDYMHPLLLGKGTDYNGMISFSLSKR